MSVDARTRVASTRANWLASVLALPVLTLVAEFLIKNTHHRPLGAAVFATFALGIWLLAELVSDQVLSPSVSRKRKLARRIVAGFGVLSCAVILVRSFL